MPLARSFAGGGAGEGSALSQTCNRDSPKGTPSQSTESVSETSNPAEAEPSPLEPQANPLGAQPSPLGAQPNPDKPTQPQLTAPDRIYPHHTVYRVPMESVTNWVWPTLVFPKLVGFPRPGTTMPSPDTPAPAADKTDEPPKRSAPDQTRESS